MHDIPIRSLLNQYPLPTRSHITLTMYVTPAPTSRPILRALSNRTRMKRTILRVRPPPIPALLAPLRLTRMLVTESAPGPISAAAAALRPHTIRLVARMLPAAIAAAGNPLLVARGGVARAVVVAAVLDGGRAVGADVARPRAVRRAARAVHVAVVRGVGVEGVAAEEGVVVGGARDELEARVEEARVAVAEEGARVLLLDFVAGHVVTAVEQAVRVVGIGAPGVAAVVGAAIWRVEWVVRLGGGQGSKGGGAAGEEGSRSLHQLYFSGFSSLIKRQQRPSSLVKRQRISSDNPSLASMNQHYTLQHRGPNKKETTSLTSITVV